MTQPTNTTMIKDHYIQAIDDNNVYSFGEMEKILTKIYMEITHKIDATKYELNKIIKIQSIFRRHYENKNNIYNFLRNKYIKENFKKEILGYHIMNKQLITGTLWEEINRNIVKEYCEVSDGANGDHKSGKDNRFKNWNISNKANNIDKNNNISISSYRLTEFSSSHNMSDEHSIKKVIEEKDSSFDYYSILLKKQKPNEIINYRWYIIPRDLHVFNVSKYPMTPLYGKLKQSKGRVVGWQSKYCDIRFSMSSQLWFRFNLQEIEKYLIADVDVDINKAGTYTYKEIYDRINN